MMDSDYGNKTTETNNNSIMMDNNNNKDMMTRYTIRPRSPHNGYGEFSTFTSFKTKHFIKRNCVFPIIMMMR